MLSRLLLRRPSRLAATSQRIAQPLHPHPHPQQQPQRFFTDKAGPGRARPATLVAAAASGSVVTWALAQWSSSSSSSDRREPLPGRATAADVGDVPNIDGLASPTAVDYQPAPTAQDVTAMLNEGAFSYVRGRGRDRVRYDGAVLASNCPSEDAHVHGRIPAPFGDEPGREWMAWAVFDGHCGWQLSTLLTKQLMPFVQKALQDVKQLHPGRPPSDEAIRGALESAFRTLDDELVKSAPATIDSNLSFPEKVRRLEPAFAGACALLVLYDPSARVLHVASTGDCRAVLGTKGVDGKWEPVAWTEDQTGATPEEKARIQRQFPDEPDILSGGRIWGMQPARTFGDGGWKWDKDLRARLRNEYNACRLPSATRYPQYKQGPYLTAAPVVQTIPLPDGPSCLVLATDGLWDTMQSAQAIDLVGRWTTWQRDPKAAPVPPPGEPSRGLPPSLGSFYCYYDDEHPAFQDRNAAAHLIRNGLGGGHDEMVRGALAFSSPMSRDIRDDMTVQVIFFGEDS